MVEGVEHPGQRAHGAKEGTISEPFRWSVDMDSKRTKLGQFAQNVSGTPDAIFIYVPARLLVTSFGPDLFLSRITIAALARTINGKYYLFDVLIACEVGQGAVSIRGEYCREAELFAHDRNRISFHFEYVSPWMATKREFSLEAQSPVGE